MNKLNEIDDVSRLADILRQHDKETIQTMLKELEVYFNDRE